MHKKITAALLAGVMLLFAGCGNKTAVASAEIDDATVFDEEIEEFSGEYDAEILEFDEDMAASKLSVSLFEEDNLTPPPTHEPTPTPEPTPVPTATPKPTKKPTPTEKATVTKSPTKYNSNLNIDDNVFLDALEYAGYNLQKHRADGKMWVFIHGKNKRATGYLSKMGYSPTSSGYETNAAGDPDIARITKNGGLVCASYVTYVYFNYLPNIAGIDMSGVPRPGNPRLAQSWRLTAEKWVEMGLSRKIKFTAHLNADGSGRFEPEEDVPIGSIMVYKMANASNSAAARHVGIYAGCKGGYHWMTHVGNERGPEMITVERMGYSSTREIVMEVITPPVALD